MHSFPLFCSKLLSVLAPMILEHVQELHATSSLTHVLSLSNATIGVFHKLFQVEEESKTILSSHEQQSVRMGINQSAETWVEIFHLILKTIITNKNLDSATAINVQNELTKCLIHFPDIRESLRRSITHESDLIVRSSIALLS